MPITSSTHSIGHAQGDGRRYVAEQHTDSTDAVHRVEYLALADANNIEAVRDARAGMLSIQLAEIEAGELLSRPTAIQLLHQTAAEFAARFWARVQAARAVQEQIEFCRLMWWLTRRLVAGDITDAQARNSFNTAFNRTLTGAQWTTMRANKITPAHDRYQAILDEGDF